MDLKLFKTDFPCHAVFHQVGGRIGHLRLLFFVFVLIVLNNDMPSSSVHVSLEITSPSICASCSPKLSLKERATSLLSRSGHQPILTAGRLPNDSSAGQFQQQSRYAGDPF